MDRNNITGVILAGGAGSRVGSRDKGLIHWRGRPLVSYVCATLKPDVKTLLISCNRNENTYAHYADATAVDGREGFVGPLGGLESIHAMVTTEFVVLAPCDVPQLPSDYVHRLVQPLLEHRSNPLSLSFAHDGDNAHYLCAALRTECLHSLHHFLDSGQRRVQDWIAQQAHVIVDVSDIAPAFENLNHTEDFTE